MMSIARTTVNLILVQYIEQASWTFIKDKLSDMYILVDS